MSETPLSPNDLDIKPPSTPPDQAAEVNPFDVSDIEHDLVTQYKPKYVGRGGEQIVYAAADHPDSVIKVSSMMLKQIVDSNRQGGLPADSLTDTAKRSAEDIIKTDNERFQKLLHYFGKERTLNQKKYLLRVPVNQSILDALYKGDIANVPNITEAWSIATVQQRAKELEDSHFSLLSSGSHMSSESGDPERDDAYRKTLEALLKPTEGNAVFDKESFLSLYPHLVPVLDSASTSEDFRNVLTDLVTRSVSYSKGTGEILDIFGKDNLVFHTKNGRWNYRLLDVLTANGGDTTTVIEDTKSAFTKLATGSVLDIRDQSFLLDGIRYAGCINGLATYLGLDSEQFIELIPQEHLGKSLDLLSVLKGEKQIDTLPGVSSPVESSNEQQTTDGSRDYGEPVDALSEFSPFGLKKYKEAVLLTEGILGARVSASKRSRTPEEGPGYNEIVDWYVPPAHAEFFEKRKAQYEKDGTIIPFLGTEQKSA